MVGITNYTISFGRSVQVVVKVKRGASTVFSHTRLKFILCDICSSAKSKTIDVNFSNLEFQLFSYCEPSIKSSIFANVSFSAPPPPSNVAASSNTACVGTPVTLTANCAVTTTPYWYTQAVGGFPIGSGSSVTVNPSVNTTYYIGCETANYVRDRVATKLVLVGTPSTVLNLTTNYTTGSTLQIASNTITATKIILMIFLKLFINAYYPTTHTPQSSDIA